MAISFVGRGLAAIVVTSVLMVVLGLVFFMATSWIVTIGTQTATGARPGPDFTALAAALLTLGALVGGRRQG